MEFKIQLSKLESIPIWEAWKHTVRFLRSLGLNVKEEKIDINNETTKNRTK